MHFTDCRNIYHEITIHGSADSPRVPCGVYHRPELYTLDHQYTTPCEYDYYASADDDTTTDDSATHDNHNGRSNDYHDHRTGANNYRPWWIFNGSGSSDPRHPVWRDHRKRVELVEHGRLTRSFRSGPDHKNRVPRRHERP